MNRAGACAVFDLDLKDPWGDWRMLMKEVEPGS